MARLLTVDEVNLLKETVENMTGEQVSSVEYSWLLNSYTIWTNMGKTSYTLFEETWTNYEKILDYFSL